MAFDPVLDKAVPIIRKSKIKKLLTLIWKNKIFYLMLLPGLIYFVIYKYMPMYGVIIAFKDFNIMDGIVNSSWADPWYKHFKAFYDSPYFTELITNTVLISFYKLIFGIVPPIIFALLLHECRLMWYKRIVQTLSYMPHFLSWVIIYGILLAFLSESTGLLNRWLSDVGVGPINFLTSLDWFRTVLVGSDIWQNMGWGAIIYLAGMSGINPEYYEAARVDGASRLRMIWHITLPGIRNLIILLFILQLGRFMDAGFEQIYILYNVQVYPVADIIDTWVFRVGLQQMNFSLGAAVGLFKSIIGLVLVLGSNKLANRWGGGIW